MVVDKKTEIRRLTLNEILQIAVYLDRNNGWQKLMRIIPKIVEVNGELVVKGFKYNLESERLIHNASDKYRRPGQILFDEWGCSGKVRPTIELLQTLLVKAELFPAADFIAESLLNEPKPERPKAGPARPVDITLPPDEETNAVNKIMSEISYPNSSGLAADFVSVSTMKNKDFYEKIDQGNVQKVIFDPNQISDMIKFSTQQTRIDRLELNGNLIPIPPPRRQKSPSKLSNSNNASSEINIIPSLSALQLSVINNNSYIPQIPDLSDFNINSEASQISSEISTTSSSTSSESSSNFTIPNVSMEIPQISIFQQSQTDIPNLSELNFSSEEEEMSTQEFSYAEVKEATDQFNSTALKKDGSGGRKIGAGGFGVVYLAVNLVKKVKFTAVKQLKAETYKCQEKFNIEIDILSKHSHENLVELLGYSKDGSELCLIYEYIEGGNLQEKLYNCRRQRDILTWKERIEISMGCANGICFLHEIGLIHRDIKSANILLKGTIPKLCDFGLMKKTNSNTTTAIIGTAAYMAPEGIRGDTSEKLDIFALGVVILELLTGLEVVDKHRRNNDLVTYVLEMAPNSSNIPRILIDENAGKWNHDDEIENLQKAAHKFYGVAFMCLEEKRKRPNIEIIKDLLNSIYSNYC